MLENVNFVRYDTLEMWILWKLRFWKCEFCENYFFENVNLSKKCKFRNVILVKIGNIEMWILPKMRIMIFGATPSVQNEDQIKKSWTLPISEV